ncbi:hypothetical protein [Sphingobacterium kitahiroshimense]|uniref:hypothetical protein n=1 Tax=Sphingobacterium kitahiroshimense TaxID=470446 RepID=UPI003209B8BD
MICIATGLISCGNNNKEDKAVQIAQDSILLDSISHVDSTAKETTKDEAESLEEVLEKIARAYADQNSKIISRYIHPTLGIYIIYRPGAIATYVHQSDFSFSRPVPDAQSYGTISYNGPLKEEKLPKFDCGTMKWEKSGFFYDKNSRPTELSHTAQIMNEILNVKIDAADLQQIKNIETKSYRAIMTANENEKPFVFQVTQDGEKWYLTLIDLAYAGCEV